MLQLIEHIIQISSKRDRTEVNSALVDTMEDLFAPHAFAIYRCFPGTKETIVFRCAGRDATGRFSHNAYLPDRRFCQPIEHDPLLLRSQTRRSLVLERLADGSDRLVFPVVAQNQPIYLIDIVLPADFPAGRRGLLMGLVEYFGHHLALLDYGEADTLTGLANRKTFEKHLFEVLGRATDDAGPAGASRQRRRRHRAENHWLGVCDIDHFKRVNDSHGHLAGDSALVSFSRLMRESFRYDDQLFRFGGEEFIAVLQPADRGDVQEVFERFRRAVEAHDFAGVGRITVSIGYCQLLPHDTPPAIIDRADAALYWAKQNGRNRVACYDPLVHGGQLPGKAGG